MTKYYQPSIQEMMLPVPGEEEDPFSSLDTDLSSQGSSKRHKRNDHLQRNHSTDMHHLQRKTSLMAPTSPNHLADRSHSSSSSDTSDGEKVLRVKRRRRRVGTRTSSQSKSLEATQASFNEQKEAMKRTQSDLARVESGEIQSSRSRSSSSSLSRTKSQKLSKKAERSRSSKPSRSGSALSSLSVADPSLMGKERFFISCIELARQAGYQNLWDSVYLQTFGECLSKFRCVSVGVFRQDSSSCFRTHLDAAQRKRIKLWSKISLARRDSSSLSLDDDSRADGVWKDDVILLFSFFKPTEPKPNPNSPNSPNSCANPGRSEREPEPICHFYCPLRGAWANGGGDPNVVTNNPAAETVSKVALGAAIWDMFLSERLSKLMCSAKDCLTDIMRYFSRRRVGKKGSSRAGSKVVGTGGEDSCSSGLPRAEQRSGGSPLSTTRPSSYGDLSRAVLSDEKQPQAQQIHVHPAMSGHNVQVTSAQPAQTAPVKIHHPMSNSATQDIDQLPLNFLPRLIGVDVAAWMLDPDDSRKSDGFQFNHLYDMYCSVSKPRLEGQRLLTAEATNEMKTCLQDVSNLASLWAKLELQLARANMLNTFKFQEMLLTQILAEMQVVGVPFDDQLFRKRRGEVQKELRCIEQQAYALVGHQFLLTSPTQLAKILYDELKLPKLTPVGKQKGKNTHHSTGEAMLSRLISYHALPALILKHRGLSKILTTYMDPMLQVSIPIFLYIYISGSLYH